MKYRMGIVTLTVFLFLSAPCSFAASTATLELNAATSADLMQNCAFDQDLADRIIEMRDTLGGFQSWDDLKELELSDDALLMIQSMYLITGIAADCNC